ATGTLSTQWVLDQVPGSEGLIETITGQRFPTTRKVNPKMATENGHAEKAKNGSRKRAKVEGDQCWCGKDPNHVGRHRGVSTAPAAPNVVETPRKTAEVRTRPAASILEVVPPAPAPAPAAPASNVLVMPQLPATVVGEPFRMEYQSPKLSFHIE